MEWVESINLLKARDAWKMLFLNSTFQFLQKRPWKSKRKGEKARKCPFLPWKHYLLPCGLGGSILICPLFQWASINSIGLATPYTNKSVLLINFLQGVYVLLAFYGHVGWIQLSIQRRIAQPPPAFCPVNRRAPPLARKVSKKYPILPKNNDFYQKMRSTRWKM